MLRRGMKRYPLLVAAFSAVQRGMNPDCADKLNFQLRSKPHVTYGQGYIEFRPPWYSSFGVKLEQRIPTGQSHAYLATLHYRMETDHDERILRMTLADGALDGVSIWPPDLGSLTSPRASMTSVIVHVSPVGGPSFPVTGRSPLRGAAIRGDGAAAAWLRHWQAERELCGLQEPMAPDALNELLARLCIHPPAGYRELLVHTNGLALGSMRLNDPWHLREKYGKSGVRIELASRADGACLDYDELAGTLYCDEAPVDTGHLRDLRSFLNLLELFAFHRLPRPAPQP